MAWVLFACCKYLDELEIYCDLVYNKILGGLILKMRKFKIAVTLLLSIVSFVLSFSLAFAEGKNIILNPGFEYGNESWSVYSPNAQVDTKLSCTGKRSLHFGPYTERFRTMNTKRYSIDSKDYLCKVSYYNTSSEGEVILRLRYVKKDGSAEYVNLPKLDLSKVDNWNTAEFNVEVPDFASPADTIQIYIYVGSTYPGDLWLDDFVLQAK